MNTKKIAAVAMAVAVTGVAVWMVADDTRGALERTPRRTTRGNEARGEEVARQRPSIPVSEASVAARGVSGQTQEGTLDSLRKVVPRSVVGAAPTTSKKDRVSGQKEAITDSEIAEVLGDPVISAHVKLFLPPQWEQLERSLAFYRSHRWSAESDLQSAKEKAISTKLAVGDVTPLPKVNGESTAIKPEPPPGGQRYVGWPHTVGETSYWVTLVEAENPEYFELLAMRANPTAALRSRVMAIGSGLIP